MTGKTVFPSQPALVDIREAVLTYAETASDRVVSDFLMALEDAYRFISSNPAAGSPRYAHQLNISGLRGWRLRRFPFIAFYIEGKNRIDVIRVLHAHRDIAASLWNLPDDQSATDP